MVFTGMSMTKMKKVEADGLSKLEKAISLYKGFLLDHVCLEFEIDMKDPANN